MGADSSVCIICQLDLQQCVLTIYAPMIYTAPCVMFLMRAADQGQEGWGLVPGNQENFGPCKMASSRHAGECHFGPKKFEIFRAQPPPTCLSNGSAHIIHHYVQGRINHRCIGTFMYRSPRMTLTGCKWVFQGGFRAHTTPTVWSSNITPQCI